MNTIFLRLITCVAVDNRKWAMANKKDRLRDPFFLMCLRINNHCFQNQ